MSKPTNEQKILNRFLEVLAERGGTAGNFAMMHALGLETDEYWPLRNKLLDRGVLTLGRGRGGSVILVSQEPEDGSAGEQPETAEDQVAEKYPDEASLYEPCLATLESNWASANRLFGFRAEVTARQGSRKTGGVWTRPDIAALSVRTFPYWPGRHYDLWTFEIKHRNAFNVLGLFEALAHARMATQSWALYQVDEQMLGGSEDLERMTSEAQRLGVGFIVFTDPADFETWDTRVNSVRTSPDPSLHDEFVKTQLSEGSREMLLQWAR